MSPPRIIFLALLTVSCVVPAAPVQEGGHVQEFGAGSQVAAVFVGGSGEFGDLEGVTLGVEYGRRIGDWWGVNVFAEAVTGLDRSFAAGLELFVNPVGELILHAGPGLERHDADWGAIGRLGVSYEFPLEDGWGVAPGVFYDFSEHTDLLIYGVSTGVAW